MTEKNFQEAIVDVAKLYGWLAFSIPDSRRCSEKGWPDLALLHPAKHKFLVRELKLQRGVVSPDQHIWITGLQQSGIDAGVWRPSDWQDIVEKLTGKSMHL
jgi:VRR-NUC domain